MNKTTSLQQQLCLHTYIFLQVCVSFHCIILNMDLIPLLTDTVFANLLKSQCVDLWAQAAEFAMHIKDMKIILKKQC